MQESGGPDCETLIWQARDQLPRSIGVCTAGPDAFPNDPAAWIDTDGDGKPDDIVPGFSFFIS